MMNILIGVTGSVATIKLNELISTLKQNIKNVNIKVVATEKALHFIDLKKIKDIECEVELLLDADEWKRWNERDDPVLHIELRKWADLMLIAPLDANTLAKISNGICDNLLCCIVRAWDLQKPLLLAPAMNTFMWNHPITTEHLKIIKSIGYIIIEPIEKKLICGDIGLGAMAPVNQIVKHVTNLII